MVIGIDGGVISDRRRRVSISADMVVGSELAEAADGQKMCHGVRLAGSGCGRLARLVPRKSMTGPGAPFRMQMFAESWSG